MLPPVRVSGALTALALIVTRLLRVIGAVGWSTPLFRVEGPGAERGGRA